MSYLVACQLVVCIPRNTASAVQLPEGLVLLMERWLLVRELGPRLIAMLLVILFKQATSLWVSVFIV